MATDLSDLVPYLQAEIGAASAAQASSSELVQALANAFWNARIQGVTALQAYTEADGIVTPNSVSTVEMSRDLGQVIVLFAGIDIVAGQLRNLQTVFRAKAGSVEYETQQAAGLLRDVLAIQNSKRQAILKRLSDLGSTDVMIIDSVNASTESMINGFSSFLTGSRSDWLNYNGRNI